MGMAGNYMPGPFKEPEHVQKLLNCYPSTFYGHGNVQTLPYCSDGAMFAHQPLGMGRFQKYGKPARIESEYFKMARNPKGFSALNNHAIDMWLLYLGEGRMGSRSINLGKIGTNLGKRFW